MTVQEAKEILGSGNIITANCRSISITNKARDIAIECMEELKEAREKQKSRREWYQQGYRDGLNADKWIPCEERLPSEDEEVIISTKTERVYIGVYTTRYGENKREGFICEDGFIWMNVTNAWQPLPQPYKKEGAENE